MLVSDVAKAFLHNILEPLIVDLARRKALQLLWYVRAIDIWQGGITQ